MPVYFCPIASGSNGNSTYVGCGDAHILFDAGLSGKSIQSGLRLIKADPAKIDAIFITHEHSDHIQSAGVLSRRFDIPIYATAGTWAAMECDRSFGFVSDKNKRVICYDTRYDIRGITVKPFEIPHDASEPAGYNVFAENLKISILTDIGQATDAVKDSLYHSDIMLVESNHDVEMLKKGPYPWPLKKRILSEKGHLSNAGCGVLLSEIMSERIKYVYLAHLSEENNRPYLAMDTVTGILESNGIYPGRDFNLAIANRGFISDCITLGG